MPLENVLFGLRKSLFILFITGIIFLTYSTSFAQGYTLSEAAKMQLDTELIAGKLKRKIEKAGIKGTYNFDITIHKKGEVLTVFAYSNENTDIPSQNTLKGLIKEVKFDLSVPDNTRIKFNYSFNL